MIFGDMKKAGPFVTRIRMSGGKLASHFHPVLENVTVLQRPLLIRSVRSSRHLRACTLGTAVDYGAEDVAGNAGTFAKSVSRLHPHDPGAVYTRRRDRTKDSETLHECLTRSCDAVAFG